MITDMHAAEPLPHFVDDYLGFLYEVHPTGATMDGVHIHDDLVEDYRRDGYRHASERAGRLCSPARCHSRRAPAPCRSRSSIRSSRPTSAPASSSSKRCARGSAIRTTTPTRSPSSLAAQAIFTYAPETERARRVLSKLRQVPRLVQAARDNIKEPPAIFVKVGIDTWRGAMSFIDTDLPRAFSSVDDMHLLGDLADACKRSRARRSAPTSRTSRTTFGPRRKGTFRLGRDRFEQKLRLEEGITLPVDRLLAIAMRELEATQEEFRSVAGRLNGGDPIAAWRKAKQKHPEPGTLIATAREAARRAPHLPVAQQPSSPFPTAAACHVAPTPEFFRWSSASMWTPGPFEIEAVARDVLPDRRRSDVGRGKASSNTCATSTCRRCGRSRSTRSIPATFSTTSTLRKVDSKVRRSTMFAPASYIEGWAHYCEQMMLEAGFGRGDHALKLGQLAESLVRLARFVVGIRLHTEDWSVEQGVRFFQEEAFLEEASARREAERGTFDPTYLVYSAGKMMLLKLRRDWQEEQGGKPSLRAFHDAFLSQGAAPFWALRRLMLKTHDDAVLDVSLE